MNMVVHIHRVYRNGEPVYNTGPDIPSAEKNAKALRSAEPDSTIEVRDTTTGTVVSTF